MSNKDKVAYGKLKTLDPYRSSISRQKICECWTCEGPKVLHIHCDCCSKLWCENKSHFIGHLYGGRQGQEVIGVYVCGICYNKIPSVFSDLLESLHRCIKK